MSSDRVQIRKRNGRWQIRRGTTIVQEFDTHQQAMDYVAAAQKIRAVVRALGERLQLINTKGTSQ